MDYNIMARLPCPSPTPRACSNSCPLGQWWHPTISSSVTSFSSWPQSFPASGLFHELTPHIRWPKYWSFSFTISTSNEYSGLIFLLNWLGWSPGRNTAQGTPSRVWSRASPCQWSEQCCRTLELSRVISITTVWKHQFFGAQSSLWSNSHIHTWLLRKTWWCLCFLIHWVCHNFSSKEQESFNFMAAVTIHSDFGAQENSVSLLPFLPFYLPWSDGTGCRDLRFLNIEF